MVSIEDLYRLGEAWAISLSLGILFVILVAIVIGAILLWNYLGGLLERDDDLRGR